MEYKSSEEKMLAALDHVIRILRRQPAGKQHLGRGVYRVLNIIEQNKEIVTRELADRLNMRTSSLNEKLGNLLKEGYIERERDPEDRRVFRVSLNEKGEELLEELRLERKRRAGYIGSILTEEEIEEMTRIAVKLGEGLQAAGDKGEQEGDRQ